jgi:hypothetical protein
MLDKFKWFGKRTEQGVQFSEENYNKELEAFLSKRVNNTWLTEAGKEHLRTDINEHITNGVTKEEIFNDLKKLSRDSFISKYTIDRRSVDEQVSDTMNTAMLRISETLRSKKFTEAAVEILFSRAQDEIVDDPESFERKLEKMSADEINKAYFQ